MDNTKRSVLSSQILILIAILFSCLISQTYAADEQKEDCRKKATVINAGMTRSEIEARMEHDGGMAGIYKGERLFFAEPGKGLGVSQRQYCMLAIDFRPYGLPNEIYRDVNRFAQWLQTTRYHPHAKDTAEKLLNPSSTSTIPTDDLPELTRSSDRTPHRLRWFSYNRPHATHG